ncbi:hypothetical protein SAMN05421766_108112 [Zobellia uliginosa]|uniref:Uncharacterized protein n=1 Tax=Zobellia uliginosa TaxID=143224 RepID=A0ABY1L158_9FLAO|nr:hypothetical protein [Zobellia uliginosa]SIT06763.1 hypothetical protein SAMN05421766_108112 [Zobellia uliginosa]
MAVFVKNCERYSAFLYPNGSNSGRINLYCADGNRLYLLFKNGALPANSYDDSTKSGVGYEPMERFSDYLDLIRNEKPIWVTFNTSRKTYVVYTSGEEVGEGEM